MLKVLRQNNFLKTAGQLSILVVSAVVFSYVGYCLVLDALAQQYLPFKPLAVSMGVTYMVMGTACFGASIWYGIQGAATAMAESSKEG